MRKGYRVLGYATPTHTDTYYGNGLLSVAGRQYVDENSVREECMRTNIKVLGWLYIVLGILGVLGGILALFILLGTGLLIGEREAVTVMTIVGVAVAALVTLVSLPGIAVGVGLLKFKQWARVLALVLAFLNLFAFPLGTVLAIYTFVSLLGAEVEQLFS